MYCILQYAFVLLKDVKTKVDNLYCTDNGEPSEKSHGASNCRQHVHKLCCSVLCDSVKCWGVKIDPHKSQLVFPFKCCNECK